MLDEPSDPKHKKFWEAAQLRGLEHLTAIFEDKFSKFATAKFTKEPAGESENESENGNGKNVE